MYAIRNEHLESESEESEFEDEDELTRIIPPEGKSHLESLSSLHKRLSF